jgi:protein-arginine deiminase
MNHPAAKVWALLLGASALAFACTQQAPEDDEDDEGGTSTTAASGGAGGSGGGTGASVDMPCEPGTVIDCYTGPPATNGVGVCIPGSQVCNADGSGYGPCDGEVTPITETCNTEGDDDCDGLTNEDGPDCSCNPGSTIDCYSGPPSTKDVGICMSGTQQCNQQGTGYGPCNGEVLPLSEDCNTTADEDCDGMTPACPEAVVDLRADNNRNGTIDLTDPTEDNSENTFSSTHGAVFLANLDDDQSACPTTGTDSALAACHDAADTVINGNNDLIDLARIKSVAWPAAPNDASASLTVSNPGASNVRLFKKSGSNFSVYTLGGPITAAELQAGVEFAIEGKDIVRNSNTWDGIIDVTWNVNGGTGPNGPISGGSDTVRMRLAPVIFPHHNNPATKAYVTNINSSASQAFRTDLATATGAAGIPTTEFFVSDQWTQDFFETAYMSMPGTSGPHTIHINFRSANYTSSTLRSAGRVVYTVLRGPNVAGAVEYNSSHPDYMDTLNSFGNLETIPPYTGWPMGRVLRGSTTSFYPDPDFDLMVQSQGHQDIVYIDTEWLLVGHVDETISFVKANTPRGWVMLRNDPTLAKTMLQTQQTNGYGSTQMFVGKYWTGSVPAAVSINSVLANTEVINESAWAATQVQSQVNAIVAATGLTTSEIIPVPFLHEQSSGYSVAYQPGTVNGIYSANNNFGAAKPHGPVINSVDIFRQQLQNALSPYGVNVYWIEDWDLYHRLLGEVHCGSNVTRAIPTTNTWWESGL